MFSLSPAVDNSPLTIAHVLTSLCIGGGERVALLLAAGQVRLGHRVSVVSFEEPPDGSLGEEFIEAGVSIHRVPKRHGFDWTLPPRLAALFLRERFDVVHTHNPLPLIYAPLAAKGAGARIVHTKHGPHPDKPHRLWMRRIGAFAASSFIAVSEATEAFARELHEVSPRKLRVITNATDLERFSPDGAGRAEVRARWGVEHGDWVIGTVGRMAAVKNHPLLIRAVAPLLGPQVRLVIAGDGPEAESTAALVDELGIGRFVKLLGETRDVPDMLRGLDLFALSSHVEGLPLVLAEAMATALPVVATSVGGVPKVVVDGETGHLVPPGDEQAMRAAVAGLERDRDRARRYGRQARVLAEERYSVLRMGREYMDAYGR